MDHRHRRDGKPHGTHHRQAAGHRGAGQGEGGRTVVALSDAHSLFNVYYQMPIFYIIVYQFYCLCW